MEDFILKQLLSNHSILECEGFGKESQKAWEEHEAIKKDFSWPYEPNLIKPILHNRAETPSKAIEKQVGGDHYKGFTIQPAEFCHVNNIPYLEATAIKYLCRWKKKGGVQDLDKAIHFIELLKEFENASNAGRT